MEWPEFEKRFWKQYSDSDIEKLKASPELKAAIDAKDQVRCGVLADTMLNGQVNSRASIENHRLFRRIGL
jgi:hypothetical protein